MTRIGNSVWCCGVLSKELESPGFKYLENRLRNPCFIKSLVEAETLLNVVDTTSSVKFIWILYDVCKVAKFNSSKNSLVITLNRSRSFNQTFIAIVNLLFYRGSRTKDVIAIAAGRYCPKTELWFSYWRGNPGEPATLSSAQPTSPGVTFNSTSKFLAYFNMLLEEAALKLHF